MEGLLRTTINRKTRFLDGSTVERMIACPTRNEGPARSGSSTIDLSIVIVTWNNEREIGECLQSIRDHQDGLRCEIVVVDNASRDRSCSIIRHQFPESRLIVNAENRGFPLANNQALDVATGRYILFLNPDTILRPRTLRACVDYLETHPDTGAVGSKLIYPDGEIQYDGARKFPDLVSLFFESFYLHMLMPRVPIFSGTHLRHWDHLDSREVPCLSGAFMLIRAEVVRRLGGMNADVFMFHEDMDLCARIRQAGWRIYYLASVETVHRHGASRSGAVSSLAGPTLWTFFRRHRGPRAAMLCRGILLLRAISRLVMGTAALAPLGLLRRPRQTSLTDLSAHWKLLKWAIGWDRQDARHVPVEVRG